MGDKTRIVVAQMARVYLADVGTAAPADATTALAAAWKEVGYFTPDSLAWATDPSFQEVRSHQSAYPTRRFQTEDTATAEVDLQEWSEANFKAVYGGGTVTEILPSMTPKQYRFAPPAIGGRTQVAAVIEIVDGAKHYRRVIPLAEQSEGVQQKFERTSESTLPLRLTILGADVGDSWYDLILDDAFAPAA
jgi:hypothetical protein